MQKCNKAFLGICRGPDIIHHTDLAVSTLEECGGPSLLQPDTLELGEEHRLQIHIIGAAGINPASFHYGAACGYGKAE
ncbi:hypothetical protein D3C73_1601760 [compost metagenome]